MAHTHVFERQREVPLVVAAPSAAEVAVQAAERFRRQVVPAYSLLWLAMVLVPIVSGADKFVRLLVDWPAYVAPAVTERLGMSTDGFLKLVGGAEIGIGLLAALAPGPGGMLAAVWLWCVAGNLLLTGVHRGQAGVFIALSLAALALSTLSRVARRRYRVVQAVKEVRTSPLG